MFDMVASIVNLIIPDSAAEIVFINLWDNRERGMPLCKVKFAKRDIAIKTTKEFDAKKEKDKIMEDWEF